MKLTFSNRFSRELSADTANGKHPRSVRAAFSRVDPITTSSPELVAVSEPLARDLGITLPADSAAEHEFAAVFSGNRLLEGMDPYAMCYGGHQFGNWAGQLGDGRAIALGEIETPSGDHQTLQLKGAGPTPYSRSADGLAVLRSSIREFLCSEAMHHLGVPTTRALSLVLTGDRVMRDMLYDGNPAEEPGATVCRVAPSFVRFGNFELASSRGDLESLRAIADFTIRHDYPHLKGASKPTAETYAAWFSEIAERTATMIVEWMRVGFVHGVMNTDNMSILGLTIDYGPYGWLDNYDPDWTPNTTDRAHRRYRFGHQPAIAEWNLAHLANAIFPLIEDAEPLQAGMAAYVDTYQSGYRNMMLSKLGLPGSDGTDGTLDHDEADSLIEELTTVLTLTETDFTIFFRALAELPSGGQALSDTELVEPLLDAYYAPEELSGETLARTALWLRRYHDELADAARGDSERRQAMNKVNPKYVMRNYLAQLAIDASTEGDHSMVRDLLSVMTNPYDDQPEFNHWAQKRPDWARSKVGCSQLSCSS